MKLVFSAISATPRENGSMAWGIVELCELRALGVKNQVILVLGF
jgi:hypothetical protein